MGIECIFLCLLIFEEILVQLELISFLFKNSLKNLCVKLKCLLYRCVFKMFLRPIQFPSGSSDSSYERRRQARVYGGDGWDGMDGVSTVSCNFFILIYT